MYGHAVMPCYFSRVFLCYSQLESIIKELLDIGLKIK